MVQLLNGIKVLLISDQNVRPNKSETLPATSENNDDEVEDIEEEDDGEEKEDEEEEEDEDEEEDGEEEEEEKESETEDDIEKQGKKCTDRSKEGERMAAASLCVSVGSFSDPSDLPGLAHFLEHMVFMGSEKYTQENAFDEFLKVPYYSLFLCLL